MSINTNTRLQQVKTYLLQYIRQHHLRPNDQLPSEAEMARMLGVSRNTIREAYISLENEGIIVRRHGVGTFVAHFPLIRDSLNEFSPFAQIIREGGYTPSFRTLSAAREAPSAEVRDALHVSTAQSVLHIRRLVRADRRPVIYVEDYLAPQVDVSGIDWDTFDGRMVHLLADRLGTPLHRIQSCIRAAAADPLTAQYLELMPGAPILSVRSTIYALNNQPVMYSRVRFNSDVVELSTVRMLRTP